MSGHQQLSDDVDIDIGGLGSSIWNKKWPILLVSLLAGAAIFLFMNSISPRYQTTSQIILEPRESRFTRVQQQNGIIANEFDTAAVLSQVQIILSDDVALSTIKKLDLASKREFNKEAKPSIFADLFVLIGLRNDPLDISPDERVLNKFKKRLKAYSVNDSRVIEIYFWANDRKLARDITNTIAKEYLALQRKSKLETDSSATRFLEPEIAALRKKVRAAEANVAEFRSSSDILVANNNALLATQQLSEVSTELSRVRAQRSAAQARVESVRSTIDIRASLETLPEVVGSPLIQRLRERQVQLRAEISELSATLLPSHPRLRGLKSRVSDFNNQINREARAILRSLENNVEITKNQEASLVRELGRLKAEAARAGEAEVELRALEREASSERELLQTYLIKFREAAGRQNSEYLPINARIISSAYLPTESFFPKTVPYTIAGTVVTSVLSILAALTATLLSGNVLKTVNYKPAAPETESGELETAFEDVSQSDEFVPQTEVPASAISPPPLDMFDAGSGPDIFPEEPAVIIGEDTSQHISVSLVTEGILAMGNSRVAIVSPGGDEGSVTSWLLARNLAWADKTVALMDMTGSGITTVKMLGNLSLKGVRDYLAGEVEFDDVIHADRLSSTSVLPLGVATPADADAAMENLTKLVDELSHRYDYLIIDCGFAEPAGLVRIADDDTVILISAVKTSDAKQLESDLIESGYAETICVHPTADEMQSIANIAA